MKVENSKGFTLIELVAVIVILGILAATAAPKFMELQKDAKIATLNGVKSAVSSAISMLKAKAAVKGLSKGCGKLCISGDCPHGDVISCGDDASPNEAPENYVVWVNGHFSSNAALKDIQKITDISDDLDVSSGGPAQNLCI